MFIKNCFKIFNLIFVLTCSSMVAMDHDGAGPSAASSENKTIIVRSGAEVFELALDQAKKLPKFDNKNYCTSTQKFGINLPFEIASDSDALFKKLLMAENSGDANTLLQNVDIEQLISLIWLFDFFCDQPRAEQVAQVLAEKLAQPDFLHGYLGEPINLPERWRECMRDAFSKKLDAAYLKTLTGHTNSVRCMVLMQDKKTLITGSADRTIRVWDINTGRCTKTLEGHTGWVNCMLLMPDNKTLITGSDDSTIRVWDINTGQCTKTLEGHTGFVTCMLLMPDNKTLITGSGDHTIRVWDITTGECTNVLQGHTNWVNCMVLMPDNKTLITGSYDHTIRVWDINTEQCTKVLEGHANRVECMLLLPDNKTLIIGSGDHTIRVWDIATGACTKVLEGHTNRVNCMLLLPDNQTLITGSADNTIRVWDIATGACTKVLEGHTNWVNCMLLLPDNKTLITGSTDKTIRVWELPIPEIEERSVEQLLLVLKLKQNLVKGTKQACHSGMQMLFHTLPEATQDWLIARVNRHLKLNY